MSYLHKVRRQIAVIGHIDPAAIYETSDAVRLLSCTPPIIYDCVEAGDLPVVGEKGGGRRLKFKGQALIELAEKHAEIRREADQKAREREREYKRAYDKKRHEQQKQGKPSEQQGLPINRHSVIDNVIAELDRMRARIERLR